MKRRELFAWLVAASILLLGASSVSRVANGLIASVGSISDLYSGATPLAVTAHKSGTWLIDHTSSVNHVAIVGIGILDVSASANQAALAAVTNLALIDGASSGSLQVTGTWVGGIQVETTQDNGTTYFPRTVWNDALGEVTTVRSNGIYTFPISGSISGGNTVRARMADYTSGTATVRLRASRGAFGPVVAHLGGNSFTGVRCHSQTSFVTSDVDSPTGNILVHTGNQQRIYICGIVLLPSDSALGENLALVEGTTAGCKTGTTAVFGGQAPHLAAKIHAASGFVQVQPTSWISTQTAGNPICLQKTNASSRVTGTLIYGAYPQ